MVSPSQSLFVGVVLLDACQLGGFLMPSWVQFLIIFLTLVSRAKERYGVLVRFSGGVFKDLLSDVSMGPLATFLKIF